MAPITATIYHAFMRPRNVSYISLYPNSLQTLWVSDTILCTTLRKPTIRSIWRAGQEASAIRVRKELNERNPGAIGQKRMFNRCQAVDVGPVYCNCCAWSKSKTLFGAPSLPYEKVSRLYFSSKQLRENVLFRVVPGCHDLCDTGS